MQKFENYFERLESYDEMLKVANDIGKDSVYSGLWNMIRNNSVLIEIYHFDESRLEEYFDMGNIEKTEPDTLTFFNKQHGRAFALRWVDNHFDIVTFGQYF